jgi:hypothetical protein
VQVESALRSIFTPKSVRRPTKIGLWHRHEHREAPRVPGFDELMDLAKRALAPEINNTDASTGAYAASLQPAEILAVKQRPSCSAIIPALLALSQ